MKVILVALAGACLVAAGAWAGAGLVSYPYGIRVPYVVLTTTDTPVSCSAALKGAHYHDTSLNKSCFCDGTNWCPFDAAAGSCGSATSCG